MHEGQPDRVDSAAISSLKNNRCPRGIGPIAPCPCSSVSFLPCRGYLLDPLRGSDWERYSWRPPISRACGIWAHSYKVAGSRRQSLGMGNVNQSDGVTHGGRICWVCWVP